MKKMRNILCLLLVAVLALSMCACGSKGGSDNATPKAVKPAEKDSGYVYDSVTMGTSVMPNFITGTTPAENDGACSLVFDEVFKIDANTKEVYSEILEDWHFEGENTLVMQLKDGIYFSNGDKATAEDVLYSYSSHVDRSSAYIYEFGILYDQCEIVDELTLKMQFESFYSAFFSSYTIYLYNKSWCESVGWESLEWQKPVGTGPYAVSEYKIDDRAVFTARDDYWNKENNPVVIREWVMKYYQDHSTMDMDLEAGNIAFCNISASEYERYTKGEAKGFEAFNISSGVNYFFLMGFLENDVWYNKDIREAFAIGIPWEEFGQSVLGVAYAKTDSCVPSDSSEYKSIGTYTYDLERAKELLKNAGYDENNKLKLHTVMMESPFFNKSCEAFEFYCSQMNVEFTFDLKDISATINDWMTPGAGVELGFYYDNFGSLDGQYIRGLDWAANRNGSTWTLIDDEYYDNLYMEVSHATDLETRVAKSQELQQYTYDEYLAIPFSEFTFQVGYLPSVFSPEQIKLTNMLANLANLSYASAWK